MRSSASLRDRGRSKRIILDIVKGRCCYLQFSIILIIYCTCSQHIGYNTLPTNRLYSTKLELTTKQMQYNPICPNPHYRSDNNIIYKLRNFNPDSVTNLRIELQLTMKQQTNYYFASSHEDDHTDYDVYELFQYYDAQFFHGQLEKCTVRWTKRMTLCAGTCKYQGFGSSTISLSEPLLKFRTSNELKQTLIHEMIHAYLFKTNPAACQSDGGHGPAFQQIMHSINRVTGLKISVYHSFHDEVDFYRQHIWRCRGRCRDKPPFYGYVKRSMNRAPQPADHWWAQHRRECGGSYEKVNGPEKANQNKNSKNSKKLKKVSEQKDHKSWGCGKTIEDYFKQMQKQQRPKEQQQNKGKNKSKQPRKKLSKERINSSKDKFDNQSQTNTIASSFSTNNAHNLNKLKIEQAKTIEEYCRQMDQQDKAKNSGRGESVEKVSEQPNNNKQKLNSLLKKYDTQDYK